MRVADTREDKSMEQRGISVPYPVDYRRPLILPANTSLPAAPTI
jgi:hypothetical protein